MPRIAWFSPMPPARTGIAAYSADVLPLVRGSFDIDVYDEVRAHDFVWKNARQPYDLTVYQLGNSIGHAYQWAYLTRHPGLTVLHDAQLHQARALHLLQQHRHQDYRAELRFSHPDATEGVADFVAAGFGGSLYYLWPMLRLAVECSRCVAVHSAGLAGDLRKQFSRATIEEIPMGVAPSAAHAASAAAIRRRHGIPSDAILFGCYGKITQAKRIAVILRALARVSRAHPGVRLIVAGETTTDVDLAGLAAELGVTDRVTLAGYVEDAELDDYLQAADACVCLRWPSAGETSASWLRCLAAAKPTVITDLVQTSEVPRLDPRAFGRDHDPICLAVEILDEDRTLELAMARLASDADLRATLGKNAYAYWKAHHTLERMAAAYVKVIETAMARPTPAEPEGLPHLRDDGTALSRRLTEELGVAVDFLQ